MHLRKVVFAIALIGSAAPLTLAQSVELPSHRPGQWELRMVTDKPADTPPMTMQMCVDAATDREMMDFALKISKGNCPRFDMKRAGASYVVDAECALGPIKSSTKTTITGDFQSSVNVRIEGTSDGMPGAGKGPQPMLIKHTAMWKGASCGEGMKPGDVIAGGLKLNIRQMKKLLKSLPALQIQ
jgi:hypothetical protein